MNNAKMRRSFAGLVSVVALVAAIALVTAGSASAAPPATVYDSDPGLLKGNYPSLGFEATGSQEVGGAITLAGSERKVGPLRFVLSSWGCESGTWNAGNCTTSPGARFPVDFTATIYSVGPGGSVGSPIISRSKTLNVPYRPSANAKKCTGGNAGKWFKGGTENTCYNGKAIRGAIGFGAKTAIPTNSIVALSYNTTHYGYDPIGEGASCYGTVAGCGYDALNVAFTGDAPVVGSQPRPDDAYYSSSFGSNYCDGGTDGVDVFRLDAGCWTGFQPLLKLTAK